MLTHEPAFDVVVLGGGPAGCATALALHQIALTKAAHWRVCIVDPGRSSHAQFGGTRVAGTRVGETLLPDTRPLMDQLGLWSSFLLEGHEVGLGSCSAWGAATLGYNDFLLNPQARGWHLDRQRFDAFMLRHASACTQHITGKLSAGTVRGADGFDLDLVDAEGNKRRLSARYVVDATGAKAAFARCLGVQSKFLDRVSFVYGFFDTSNAKSALRLTMLEAVEQGWWYAAQLPNQRLAVAFATDADLLRAGGLAQARCWLDAAMRSTHIAERLAGCEFLADSLCIRPAASCLLDVISGARWLAVGDAAAVYDPLAAQGIHKAISEGLSAAYSIADALELDAEIAASYSIAAVRAFEEYRVNRNHFYGLEQRWKDAPFWRRRHERRDFQLPIRG